MSLAALERTPLKYEYLSRFSHSNTGKTEGPVSEGSSTSISLSGFNAEPSVIAGFQGCSDDQWANVRFTDVTYNSIGLNIEGSDDFGSEILGYIAFETSTAESSQYLASHTNSRVHEEHYTLKYAYTFDDVPLFFGTVESSGGDDCSVQLQSPTSSNTTLYIVETDDFNYYHNNEIIHYVAMEDGTKIYTNGYVEF